MGALEISLLGPLEITINGNPIEVATNYVRALLCFLVIEKHHPHRREALAEMLWPGKPEGVARNSLKQALSNLRKALGDRENSNLFLLVTRDDVQFNQSSNYRVDTEAFSEQIAASEKHEHDDLVNCKACEVNLQQALDLYRGDFLSDFYLPDNQDFNDWIILKREVYQRQVSEILTKLASIYEIRGEIAHAIEYSRQLAEIEPWNEGNHRNLMRLLALNGMRSAALRQFQVCCDCLKEELDVEPSNATIALYEEIKTWELGAFVDDELPQRPVVESQQRLLREEDVTRKLFTTHKSSRRSLLVALVITGFILTIGSIHWLVAVRNSSAASASEKQDVAQVLREAKAETIVPSQVPTETDGIISALTAEAKAPNITATPVPTEALASASSAANSLDSQSQALTNLYGQTDGPNWENAEGWLTDLPPCEWYGVTCRGEKIVELVLNDNQLNGTIPPEIGQLGYLENLDLRNNQLKGNIPLEIGDLASLKHLYLSGNRELSGSIPPELGNLSNLETLELAHWESGGSLLSGEIPPELGNLKNLRSLSISVSLLQGSLPVELCGLTKLGDLYLDGNRLSGAIPPEIGNLISLGALDLGGNDFVGPIPPELGDLPMLEYFALGESLVSGEVPAELGNLIRLRYLVLDNTNLSGPLPLSLMNLNLRELTFFGTDVCEPDDEAFQSWLESIDDLDGTGTICD